MHSLKRITALFGLLLASTVQAHPGHPALSIEHTHRAYAFDPFLILLLMAALGVTIVLWRTIWHERRHERKL